MKKTKFLFLAGLTVACLSTNSCNNKTTKDEPVTPTEEPVSIALVVGALESQNNFIDQTFEVTVNNVKKTFSISQMTEVNPITSGYKDFEDEIKLQMNLSEITGTYKIYKYELGTLEKGQTAVAGNKTYTPKSSRPSDNEFDIIEAWIFSADGVVTGSSSVSCTGGIHNYEPDITEWCNLKCGDMGISYSY